MSDLAGLPSTRWSLRGLDRRGRRGLADPRHLAEALPLSRLPRRDRDRRRAHVVQYVHRLGGTEHHHWHRRCAEELLVPELRELKRVPAGESRAGEARGRGRRQVGAAAPLSVSPAGRPLSALYARIGRIYCGWAPTLLLLASVVFVPLGLLHALPVHVDAGAIDLDSGARGLRPVGAVLALTATGLIGEVFYSGAVAIAAHPPRATSEPPSLREIARHDQLRAADRDRPALRRSSSRSGSSLFFVPGVLVFVYLGLAGAGGRDRAAAASAPPSGAASTSSAASSGSSLAVLRPDRDRRRRLIDY